MQTYTNFQGLVILCVFYNILNIITHLYPTERVEIYHVHNVNFYFLIYFKYFLGGKFSHGYMNTPQLVAENKLPLHVVDRPPIFLLTFVLP
jgi:hypothetical protein